MLKNAIPLIVELNFGSKNQIYQLSYIESVLIICMLFIIATQLAMVSYFCTLDIFEKYFSFIFKRHEVFTEFRGLRSRFSSNRISSLKKLYFTKENFSQDTFFQRKGKISQEELHLVLANLAKQGPNSMVEFINCLNRLKLNHRLKETPLYSTFALLTHSKLAELLYDLEELKSDRIKKVIIVVAANNIPYAVSSFIEQLERYPEEEVRIGIIRAMQILKRSDQHAINLLLEDRRPSIQLKLKSLLEELGIERKPESQTDLLKY